MGLGSVTIAERKVQQKGAPVYLYNFDINQNPKCRELIIHLERRMQWI